MHSFIFIAVIAAFVFLFGLLEVILLKLFNREWWQYRWIRRLAWSFPLTGVFAVLLWGFSEYNQLYTTGKIAAVVSVLAFILEIALMFALPVSGVIHLISRLLEKWRPTRSGKDERPVDSVRRDFLRGLAAAVPAAAVVSGVGGVAGSFGKTIVEKKIMKIVNLPTDLEGLKILHISDTHLRHYVNLDNLEQLLLDAEPFAPDILFLIGDVADDLGQLPDALRMVASFNAPLGHIATLGNHEYFRGIQQVHRIYARSDIPLFVNDSVRLKVGDTTITVGGIDDPRHMGSGNEAFYVSAINQTFSEWDENEFAILLSHRPGAFTYAAERGISLTLAGHTHGGQIGFMGRSLLESSFPDSFLWGEYRRKQSCLYTSSGAGHWFPFRLACPPEAPVIELRQA